MVEKRKKVLIIGTVWLEPTSSAAGIRMLQLVRFFFEEDCEIHFATTAKKSPFSADLSMFAVQEHSILLNSPTFDVLIESVAPDIVMYDRFMTEEQFGWRIRENCPSAIQVLDAEDLHFLRSTRKKTKEYQPSKSAFMQNELTLRELASIYRTDVTLLISSYERELLINDFNVPETLLHYFPFIEKEVETYSWENSFGKKNHFVFIGNFLHAPNWDSVLLLKEKIWPEIHSKLPKAEIHIYGAYTTDKVNQLHHPRSKFIVKGRAEDAVSTIEQYRLLIAPLNFGAGIKGKFLDAVKAGTPYLTTNVGAEGINGAEGIALQEMSAAAIKMYTDEQFWESEREKNKSNFNAQFNKTLHLSNLRDQLNKLQQNLEEHRLQNIVGKMLNLENHKSTKYLSLWIEAKNK